MSEPTDDAQQDPEASVPRRRYGLALVAGLVVVAALTAVVLGSRSDPPKPDPEAQAIEAVGDYCGIDAEFLEVSQYQEGDQNHDIYWVRSTDSDQPGFAEADYFGPGLGFEVATCPTLVDIVSDEEADSYTDPPG